MKSSTEMPWLIGFVVLSVATSLAMIGLALQLSEIPLWPLVILNWVFFLPALYLTFGTDPFRTGFRGRFIKPDRQRFQICRIALAAMMLAGLIVPFSGARVL